VRRVTFLRKMGFQFQTPLHPARAQPIRNWADPTFAPQPETLTRIALVSTNSISQGEQVAPLWSWMFAQGMHIQFSQRTFRWSNEASGKAAVHCAIVGFGLEDVAEQTIYKYEHVGDEPFAKPAANINPYLIDGPSVALAKRYHPLDLYSRCATTAQNANKNR
jgi:hypothetical protein